MYAERHVVTIADTTSGHCACPVTVLRAVNRAFISTGTRMLSCG